MYRRRATLLTINSLTANSKVRRSCDSLNSSIKSLGLLRTHFTAAERSDFQNSNGENCTENEQHTSGFHVENQNHAYSQEWRHRGNTGEFQKNPDGFYGRNTVGVQQNPRIEFQQNTRIEFQQKPIIDFQHKPVGKNGNFPRGDCRESNNGSYQGNSIDKNGYYGELQQNSMGENGFRGGQSVVQHNWNGFSGSINGNHGESVGQVKNGTNPLRSDNYYSQHHQGNYYGSNGEMYPPNRSASEHYSGNAGVSQQNPNNIGNTGMAQQNPNNFCPTSTSSYQHGLGSNYAGSDQIYQQSGSGYNGYPIQNIGERYQNPSGSNNANAGNYQKISNETQNGKMCSQVSNNFESEGESVQDAESSQHGGTLEELDGFCNQSKLKEVVEVLGLLEKQHIPVDLPRYLMLMKVCGEGKALQEAKSVHEHMMRSGSIRQVSTYNKILEMYGKCGSMDDAFAVFDKMPQRNLTSWDTMITWLAKNDLGEDAIDLFDQFKKAGLNPDGPMFVGVFSACSVLGDIVEGMLHFESMTKDYGIVPSMVHYVCVADMLGSAGYLDEALEFIEKMPVEPSVDVWEALMHASRVYGHTELGDRCAEFVELMDPTRLDAQSMAGLIPVKASDLAKDKQKKKLASDNLLAVRSRVQEYRAGDRSHPETDKIYAQLRGMKEQMKEAGYVPETRFVLHDIDQEGKEEALLAHSERLAVASGLMSSPARAQMRIIKNLRVCGDCHSALKIISKLVGRELIIRDAKRFHHFKDGLCSCRDYW